MLIKTIAAVVFFSGAILGTIGLYAPMAELDVVGGTALLRMGMELVGMCGMILGGFPLLRNA